MSRIIVLFSLLFLLFILFYIKLYNIDTEINQNGTDLGNPLTALKIKHKYILSCCKYLELEPRTFASTIYAELKNNYDFYDKYDRLRSEYGYNPSVGFSQIKISTANWIENNSPYELSSSETRDELIEKLFDENTNIYYAAIYIKMIIDGFKTSCDTVPCVRTIASYYSLGIDKINVRYNLNYYNKLGIVASEFYYSNMLLTEYPRTTIQ